MWFLWIEDTYKSTEKKMPKKKPDPSPYTAEGRLKAAKEANKRQRELNKEK